MLKVWGCEKLHPRDLAQLHLACSHAHCCMQSLPFHSDAPLPRGTYRLVALQHL
jgi:hypothetical protein